MKGTIIDYLREYADVSLQEEPMNDVDSLVLCQFSYLKFDGLVPLVTENGRSVSLQQIYGHPDYEKLYGDERYEKENRALFEAMQKSVRFRKMKLNCYVNIIETRADFETQFSAVTLLLEDGSMYVAYRGTDETIVGWKEDFNMAFLSPVPGQEFAVKYLNMVTERLPHRFYIGGHSKGGNLAVYAAMNCSPQVRERIIKIYSMDGPGFRPEVLEKCDFGQIEERTCKILPHSSLVGMLFEKDIRYQVVESRTFGLAQHNPFTWLVQDGHFVTVSDIYETRRFMDDTLNEWILSLDEQSLRTFVDTLFQILSASEADNLIDFTTNLKRSMKGVVEAMRGLDEDTQKALRRTVKSLFEIAGLRMKQELRARAPKRETEAIATATSMEANAAVGNAGKSVGEM
ncbi:MAG: DUF2974 domain-containing protein [bacterium]|nr:DUF2974 domain-containing protein [bacterium]MCM1374987.1 DUF2974 domain-containing protein [Muribaculum sp.]